MGGATKWRRTDLVYHHTSFLRTNLIWMAGRIELEGEHGEPIHPVLGRLRTDPTFRRAMVDFPAVAWFTRDVGVPKCLQVHSLYFTDKLTEEVRTVSLSQAEANGITMRRVALGFAHGDVPSLTPWPDYRGYATVEGQTLNETAQEAGDDSDAWLVSEVPVSLNKLHELRVARSVQNLKMDKRPEYLERLRPLFGAGIKILPTWVNKANIGEHADKLGLHNSLIVS